MKEHKGVKTVLKIGIALFLLMPLLSLSFIPLQSVGLPYFRKDLHWNIM